MYNFSPVGHNFTHSKCTNQQICKKSEIYLELQDGHNMIQKNMLQEKEEEREWVAGS